MLTANVKQHKGFFPPHTPRQKLFIHLSLSPAWESAQHRPDLSVVFVMDTSGSMREIVATGPGRSGGVSKLDLVMEAMESVLNADILHQNDRLALISFDDEARVNVSFLSSSKRARLLAAVHSLHRYSGGTQMGAGLNEALRLLEGETGSKRIILLTDGEAMDEDLVTETSRTLRDRHIPVTAIGVGDFNESVLLALADRTQGRVLDVVSNQVTPDPPSIPASQLPQAIRDEVEQASREVITDIALSVRTVKGVSLDRITRVSPQQVEVDLARQPFTMGNAGSGVDTSFIIELSLPERSSSRTRLGQLGITYQVPGANYRGECPAENIVVEFTSDQARVQQIDQNIMQWVQQRNVEGIVNRAVQEARNNPVAAAKTLRIAHNLTQRLGNKAMTLVLDRALNELETNKTISLGTAKTIKMGSKTQILQSDNMGSLPPEEEIRKLTGV